MAVVVTGKRGQKVTLLNPAKKGGKYACEMKNKHAITNDKKRKFDENGKTLKLTREQLAYRAGYLACAKDSNRCYIAKHPNYKPKKNKSSFR